MSIKFDPIYVHDSTMLDKNQKTEKESWIGSFQLINTPTYQGRGTKIIGGTYPYGGDFSTKDEAQAYARLFAAAPQLLDMTMTLINQLTNGDFPYYPSIVDKIQLFIDKIKDK